MDKKYKISLNVDEDVQENLWVSHLRDNLYIIDSIPFYLYDINFKDIFSGVEIKDGEVRFDSLIERSPYVSFRVLIDDLSITPKLVNILDDMKISRETLSKDFWAISAFGKEAGERIASVLETWEQNNQVRYETLFQKVTLDDIPDIEE